MTACSSMKRWRSFISPTRLPNADLSLPDTAVVFNTSTCPLWPHTQISTELALCLLWFLNYQRCKAISILNCIVFGVYLLVESPPQYGYTVQLISGIMNCACLKLHFIKIIRFFKKWLNGSNTSYIDCSLQKNSIGSCSLYTNKQKNSQVTSTLSFISK